MTTRPATTIDRAASAYLSGYIRATGLALYQVADQVGIHVNTLRRYLDGSRTMALGDFLHILDTLGLDADATIAKIRELASDPAGRYDQGHV